MLLLHHHLVNLKRDRGKMSSVKKLWLKSGCNIMWNNGRTANISVVIYFVIDLLKK